MKQISFADAEYAGKRKKTRREVFLDEMEQVVPWTGGKFPPLFEPAAIAEVPWGHVAVAFTGCDVGTMSWTTSTAGLTSRSMPLARSTTLWDTARN
jgi:hypothetical protein